MSRTGQLHVDDAATVAQAVEDVRAELYPAFSRDMLLVHPKDAIVVCAKVRSRLRRKLLDEQILWAFVNQAKRSKLAIRAAARKREARAAS